MKLVKKKNIYIFYRIILKLLFYPKKERKKEKKLFSLLQSKDSYGVLNSSSTVINPILQTSTQKPEIFQKFILEELRRRGGVRADPLTFGELTRLAKIMIDGKNDFDDRLCVSLERIMSHDRQTRLFYSLGCFDFPTQQMYRHRFKDEEIVFFDTIWRANKTDIDDFVSDVLRMVDQGIAFYDFHESGHSVAIEIERSLLLECITRKEREKYFTKHPNRLNARREEYMKYIKTRFMIHDVVEEGKSHAKPTTSLTEFVKEMTPLYLCYPSSLLKTLPEKQKHRHEPFTKSNHKRPHDEHGIFYQWRNLESMMAMGGHTDSGECHHYHHFSPFIMKTTTTMVLSSEELIQLIRYLYYRSLPIPHHVVTKMKLFFPPEEGSLISSFISKAIPDPKNIPSTLKTVMAGRVQNETEKTH